MNRPGGSSHPPCRHALILFEVKCSIQFDEFLFQDILMIAILLLEGMPLRGIMGAPAPSNSA